MKSKNLYQFFIAFTLFALMLFSAKYLYISKLQKDFLKTFKVYNVTDLDGSEVRFIRHGKNNDGGYVVPEKLLQQSDVLMGYGIADDISFEEYFSDIYKKPSFGFDCGVDKIKITNPLVKFIPECIGTDKFLYQKQSSSLKISSFSSHLNVLDLKDKNIFIKMDIEGAEYEEAVFSDILMHSKQITGIVLEIHWLNKKEYLNSAVNLVKKINQKFYLIRLHGNNYGRPFRIRNKKYPSVLELTFINKNLTQDANIKKYCAPDEFDMPNRKDKPDHKFCI
jgi:hypothetical protein